MTSKSTEALYEELLARSSSSVSEKVAGQLALDAARKGRGFFSQLLRPTGALSKATPTFNKHLRWGELNSLRTAKPQQMTSLRNARAAESGMTPASRTSRAKELLEQKAARRGSVNQEQIAQSSLSPDKKRRAFEAGEDSGLPSILLKNQPENRPYVRGTPADELKQTVSNMDNAAQQPSNLGINPYTALLGGAALAGGGYAGGQYLANRDANTRRNVAFGSGLATGLAAPGALKSVNQYVNKLQQPPGYGY